MGGKTNTLRGKIVVVVPNLAPEYEFFLFVNIFIILYACSRLMADFTPCVGGKTITLRG